MKIGILTQSLGTNYGGILQNWALQQVLRAHGYKPITIVYDGLGLGTRIRRFIRMSAAYIVKFIIRHRNLTITGWPWEHKPFGHMKRFVKRNIIVTKYLPCITYDVIKSQDIKVLIVGSDQVWRPVYNINYLGMMYGDFLPENSEIPIMAYAASFGVSKKEYSVSLAEKYKKQVAKFQAISVREKSGIKLCKEYFDITAKRVFDPTLLIEAEKYRALYAKEEIKDTCHNHTAVYLLDKTPSKIKAINELCSQLGLTPVFINTINSRKGQLPSIYYWLKMIDTSEMVITDSFHGTVFSILFEKQFLSIVNHARGADRFESLLTDFELHERIIDETDIHKSKELLMKPIDYDKIKVIKKEMKDSSLDFLLTNLQR